MRTLRENDFLTLFGGVGLDDPDAAKRLGQATRHLGIDLAPFAEQWSQGLKCVRHAATEQPQHEQGDRGQPPVEPEEDPEPEHSRDKAAYQLYESGPNQVSNPL